MDKECIWRSPTGVGGKIISETSENFEKKYGVNIFSDETERSKYVPIKPSDLEFSPELQSLFKDNGKVSSPLISTNKSSTSISVSNVVPGSPRLLVSSSSGSHSPREKKESYLDYSGSTFGLQPSALHVNQPSQTSSGLSPWILSDGIPNFARNQKCTLMKELITKASAQPDKRSADVIDAFLQDHNKRQKVTESDADDTISGEELLSAIRDELKQYQSMDKKIVDAIVSVVDIPSTSS